MSTDKIQIELIETNCLMRFPCHVCGGCTDKEDVLCEGKDEDGDTWRVCETCLRNGNLDERLEAHAVDCEYNAALLRKMKGRLVVPTYEEYLAKTYEVELKYRELDAERDERCGCEHEEVTA